MPRRKKTTDAKKYKKETIPKAIREQCWLQVFGEKYKEKCYINWCKNDITVFDFHVGHDKPESQGGTLDVSNLKPICARCNLSMSNNYTIKQWDALNNKQTKNCFCW
uniref:HNH domain-containing protein n=1 Tax=viral metagenome TaxID=1070528 RepID=A0A6C0C4K8_9ZZZZ